MTVASIIGQAGDIVTEGLSWVGEVLTVITAQPLLMTFILVAFVGLGVSLVKRMMRL